MSETPQSPKSQVLLRLQAEHCRGLAAGITNRDLSQKLMALAKQLDQEAAELKPEDVVPMPQRQRHR
jgi:hypothetical protein